MDSSSDGDVHIMKKTTGERASRAAKSTGHNGATERNIEYIGPWTLE